MSNNNTTTQDKDKMIVFKGAEMKKNSKGGDYIVLKLKPEEVASVIEELTTKNNERGIRLDVHVNEKESADGRSFLSAIMFVKGIQEFGAARGGAKPAAKGTDTRSKIEALKRG